MEQARTADTPCHGDTNGAGPAAASADELAMAMHAEWRAGRRPRAEQYLEQHPELAADPESAVRLIFEEVCLAVDHGEVVDPEDVLRRFPRWRSQLELVLQCQDLLRDGATPTTFPEVGDRLGEFRILAELGRGAVGRVFLAAQPSLADRLLVLKTAPRGSEEHVSLARLQHTNVVPLYWVQEFPERNLHVLCMPFLGSVTLARVLHETAGTEAAERTGQDLIDVLDGAKLKPPTTGQSEASERERLRGLSYVRAVCWIGASLGDALQYAHERGLLHLDMKPSNVLLAADGQPMVLDFHLARTPVPAGEVGAGWLGGTREYMSPEQAEAVAAVSEGGPVPRDVDRRSDVFSLGLVLYELLGGRRGPGGEVAPDRLTTWNPDVSPGLTDIVAKCLRPEPESRYADAASLAHDLRRHLDDLPLRGVENRSLKERWQKWRRRRPLALHLIVVGLLSTALIAGGTFTLYLRLDERRGAALAALENGKDLIRRGSYSDAIMVLKEGAGHASGPFADDELLRGLQRYTDLAQRAKTAAELNAFVAPMRFYALSDPPPARVHILLQGALNLWENSKDLVRTPDVPLEPAAEEQAKEDLLDLAILRAELHVRLAPPALLQAEGDRALDTLTEVQEWFGPNAVVLFEQSAVAKALGRVGLAAEFEVRARALPVTTAWDHYALGRYHLRTGDLAAAMQTLNHAVDVHPFGFLPHLYRGVCAYRLGRYKLAVEDINFCLGQSPRSQLAVYRGMAHAAASQSQQALKDFNIAVQLDKANGEAYLQRAVLHTALERFAEATKDLQDAHVNGVHGGEILYRAAMIHAAQSQNDAARAAAEAALKHLPNHAGAKGLLERLAGPR